MVDAFLAASRGGDFEALLAVLDPDVVLRADHGVRACSVLRGAAAVAGQALTLRPLSPRSPGPPWSTARPDSSTSSTAGRVA